MLCIYYCAPDMKYIDIAPQIKIKYNPKDETLEEFLRRHQNQKIYIDASDLDLFKDISYLKNLQQMKKFKNWTLQINADQIKDDSIRIDAIKDACNKYMFTNMIGNWEVLQFILTLNPSEVYLTNMLAWELKNAYKVCCLKGVGIRLYANLAQSSWDECPDIEKFFIRPEDLNVYTQFLSGVEFAGDTKTIQEIMYETYVKGDWYGDLGEIILNFNSKIDSRRLPAEFGEWRIGCNKRCIKGTSCSLCNRMIEFSDLLERAEGQVIPPAKRDH